MKLGILLIISTVLISCASDSPNAVAAERLSQLYNESLKNIDHPYHNSRKAAMLEKKLEGLPSSLPIEARYEVAYEYLNAGLNDKVLATVEPVLKAAKLSNRNYKYHRIAAMAHLRKGEQENCFHSSGVNACTLPFTAATMHKNTRGAGKAAEILAAMLEFRPQDLESKWLLNVASAAIGREEELPKTLRVDITPAGEAGLEFRNIFSDSRMGHAGGSSLEDFDNDGDLDLFTSSYHLDENVTYYENKSGKYKDKTKSVGLEGITGGLNFIHGDVNQDGFMDVLILRGGWLGHYGHFPPSLLINEGGHRFIDKTEEWGLLHYAPTQTAAFADLDGDGDMDLVVGYERAPVKVYLNEDTTFQEAMGSGIVFNGFTKGVAVADIDNDQDMDIFLSVLGGDNKLYLNNGGMKFTDESVRYGVKLPWASFVTWFFDYDNDGYEDLYVGGYNIDNKRRMMEEVVKDYAEDTTNFSHPVLYKNIDGKYFRNVTNEVGLNAELYAMGGNFGDVNNDGFLDLYLGTGEFNMWAIMPNRLFINDSGRRFIDHTLSSGLGMIQKGHGISFGDVDGDGDQDIFHTIGGAVEGDIFMNYLYENRSSSGNSLTLKGMNIGTRVILYANDAVLHRTVGTGGSFGNNSIDLEVGLGSAQVVDSVTVNGCTFYDLSEGNKYKIDTENCVMNAL